MVLQELLAAHNMASALVSAEMVMAKALRKNWRASQSAAAITQNASGALRPSNPKDVCVMFGRAAFAHGWQRWRSSLGPNCVTLWRK